MKHIKYFEEKALYDNYISNEPILPNVSYTQDTNQVFYNPLISNNNDYSDWVHLTYRVNDPTQPVDIFCSRDFGMGEDFTFNITKVTDMMVVEADEPIAVTPTYQYTFSSIGDHTVYVKFEDMTNIPMLSFTICTSLVDLQLPLSIKSIGFGAFQGCTGLTELKLNKGFEVLGAFSFFGCTNLQKVFIPKTLNNCELADAGPFGDTIISDIVFEEGILSIPQILFKMCKELKHIDIPSSVINIEFNAFSYSGLTEITIPDSVTKIGQGAFLNCEDLVKIVVPNSINEIGTGAFSGCLKLTEINIPEQITSIPDRMLLGSGIEEIIIPEQIINIGEDVFKNCTKLEKITSLATTAPTIMDDTFPGIKSNGTLIVPEGCTNAYSSWMNTSSHYLGYYKWTIQELAE